METFNFTPNWQAKRLRKPEVNTVTFGDGYAQRIGIGANALRESYDLTFTNNATVIRQIDAFLIARDGHEEFLFTTPSGVTKKFYCEEWSADYSTYANASLSATFVQR